MYPTQLGVSSPHGLEIGFPSQKLKITGAEAVSENLGQKNFE